MTSKLPPPVLPDPRRAQKNRTPPTPSKQIVRNLGLKVTEQRIDILEVVRNGSHHFTAQDVFEQAAKRNPDIGFATVYRFLRTLADAKYVTEVRIGGLPARYEWASKDHHDHLSCTSCGKIVEFENAEIERLQERVAFQFGFLLTSHVLELYGLCPSCRKKTSSAGD